jgi:CRP/FNR family transcriptional regulator, cyclic AMP receptor protein
MPMVELHSVLERLSEHPLRVFEAGDVVLASGSETGRLLVLSRGAVDVVKNEVYITRVTEPGAVFGDMAALLGQPHSADVLAVQTSSFYVIEDAEAFLKAEPWAALYLAVVLAGRLDEVNRLLIDAGTRLAQAEHRRGFIGQTLDQIARALQKGVPP